MLLPWVYPDPRTSVNNRRISQQQVDNRQVKTWNRWALTGIIPSGLNSTFSHTRQFRKEEVLVIILLLSASGIPIVGNGIDYIWKSGNT
jgi:hypothetical protein